MPAVTSGKILVSGANGFVAVWVVKSLLERGYTVRATVRSENKGTHLRKIFASYGDKLELVTVPDITTVRDASLVPLSPTDVMYRPVHLTKPSKASTLSSTPPRPSTSRLMSLRR